MTLHISQVQALAKKALANGAKAIGPTRIEWDISGRCQSPYTREVYARPSTYDKSRKNWRPWRDALKKAGIRMPAHDEMGRSIFRNSPWVTVRKGDTTPLGVELLTPCRKCDSCKRQRRYMWYMRAKSEMQLSGRTWFGTLTLRPEEHFRYLTVARVKLAKGGTDYDVLSETERFSALAAEIGVELTKYFKRLRKQSGVKLRYLCVVEAHKSGLPHFHLLIHENGDNPVRHALLTGQWKLGFSRFKVVEENDRAAGYVSKYLVKSALVRVRASRLYGQGFEPSYFTERHALKHKPALCSEAVQTSPLNQSPIDERLNYEFLSRTSKKYVSGPGPRLSGDTGAGQRQQALEPTETG